MRRKKVLLIEDNYDNRMIYHAILEVSGYQVILAEDGAVGVDAAREHRPDIILMDLSMPVMNGWEAMQALKADPSLADIPVWALSAHVLLKRDYERAMKAGFSGYLTKPVEPKHVLSRVQSVIGSAEEGPPTN